MMGNWPVFWFLQQLLTSSGLCCSKDGMSYGQDECWHCFHILNDFKKLLLSETKSKISWKETHWCQIQQLCTWKVPINSGTYALYNLLWVRRREPKTGHHLERGCECWSINLILHSTIVPKTSMNLPVYMYLADMFINNQANCCCKIAASYWLPVRVSVVEKSRLCSVVCACSFVRARGLDETGWKSMDLGQALCFPHLSILCWADVELQRTAFGQWQR